MSTDDSPAPALSDLIRGLARHPEETDDEYRARIRASLPPEHPAPWKANGGGFMIDTKIVDANGGDVLVAVNSPIATLPYLHFVDRGVRELVIAAGEMESLLRNKYREIHGSHCDGFNHHACKREWDRQRDVLIARIDAAKAG